MKFLKSARQRSWQREMHQMEKAAMRGWRTDAICPRCGADRRHLFVPTTDPPRRAEDRPFASCTACKSRVSMRDCEAANARKIAALSAIKAAGVAASTTIELQIVAHPGARFRARVRGLLLEFENPRIYVDFRDRRNVPVCLRDILQISLRTGPSGAVFSSCIPSGRAFATGRFL